MLHGRDLERARLASVLQAAREGRASAVLVCGEPGMGKSALLDDTAACATDLRVLRTAGLEVESTLAFAALHRLLRPALDRVAAVPGPQQRALRVAFGEVEGDRIDPFLIALGALSLLTELAEDQPVLCLVDDLQWLDSASRDALLFVARRLLAEPVALVFAARDDGAGGFAAPADIPELPLTALTPTAVRSLVEEYSGTRVPDHVLDELTARTGGNPLVAIEAPAQLSSGQLTGTDVLPYDLPLSARMERTFLDRCRRLSTDAQTLMLLAAADDSLRLADLRHAGRVLGVTDDAFDDVEAAGLLRVDGDLVHVRHPLVRSALYQAATTAERRAAHTALADALADHRGDGSDSERHTWHRAAAADGPDDAVAEGLASVGARAESRGGHEAASAAYERAAHLSDRDSVRAGWWYAAAAAAYAAGRTERADALLKRARPVADGRPLRASIDRLRGRIEVVAGSAVDAHRIFIAAARDVAEESPMQALEMAALAGVLRSHGVDSGLSLSPGTPGTPSTLVQPDDPPRVRCLKLLLEATNREAVHDWGGAIAVLRTALDGGMAAEDRDVWANLGNMALHLGDDAAHRSFFAVMIAAARTDGAVMEVLYGLHRLCFSQYADSDWAGVRRTAEEALSLAHSVGQPAQTGTPLAWLTMLAALQGRDDYDGLLAAATELLAARRLGVMDGFVADVLRWARATRAGHAGDHAGSLHHFAQMRDGVVTRLAAAPRILSAVHASDLGRADSWTEEMDRFATASGLPWAQAVACYGHALLAQTVEPTEAVTWFEGSLRHYATAGRPYDAACAELAYGEHLRRAGRRIDARGHLRQALGTFRDLSAEPLAERAAAELRASGESARKRDPSTLIQLTPTELRIAQLVSGGMSNKEVAETCWISPRTVAFHLRNVFTKTGVTSRGELAHLSLG